MEGINVKGCEALVIVTIMAPDTAHGKFMETSDDELEVLSNSTDGFRAAVISAIDQLREANCTSLSNDLMQDIIVDMCDQRDNMDHHRETNTVRYRAHFDADGDGQVTTTTHFFAGQVVQIRGLVRNTSHNGCMGSSSGQGNTKYGVRVTLRNAS
jgi:hypothetical protein